MEAMNNWKLHVDVEEAATSLIETQAETFYLSSRKSLDNISALLSLSDMMKHQFVSFLSLIHQVSSLVHSVLVICIIYYINCHVKQIPLCLWSFSLIICHSIS